MTPHLITATTTPPTTTPPTTAIAALNDRTGNEP